MIEQITGNWLCWVILVLAIVCYQQLWMEYLERRQQQDMPENTDQTINEEFSAVLIGALPLLGLLGTIIGLLECFKGITSDGANNELMSGGIADALLTTQLGLTCAIPGWLLQAFIRSKQKQHNSPNSPTAHART